MSSAGLGDADRACRRVVVNLQKSPAEGAIPPTGYLLYVLAGAALELNLGGLHAQVLPGRG